jgi:hypothetical protein
MNKLHGNCEIMGDKIFMEMSDKFIKGDDEFSIHSGMYLFIIMFD